MTSVEAKTKTQMDGKAIHQGATSASEDQDQFFSLLSHVQRRDMDDQRCVLDPNKKTENVTVDSDPDMDQFFNLVADTQRCRLDDQRVSIEVLPGLRLTEVKMEAGQKPNQLGSTGPVKVGQGCSTQNLITFGSPTISKKAHSTPASACQVQPGFVSSKQTTQESASYTPKREKTKEQDKGALSDLKEQEEFFSLLSHVQRKNMDDQRCPLGPKSNIRSVCKGKNAGDSDSDMDQLFNLVTNAQRSRLDDQRVSIAMLPGLRVGAGSDQNGQVKMATGQTANQLNSMRAISDSMEQDQFFSLLSHVQRGHMDDQRCVLDPNKKILSTSKDKDPSHTDSDIEQLLNLVATTQRCRLDDQRVSIKKLPDLHVTLSIAQDGHVKTATDQQSDQHGNLQGAVSDLMDQEEFFSLLSHVQRGHLDDQRCVLNPKKSTDTNKDKITSHTDSDMDQLINLVATTQRSRLDDQRVSIGIVPGLYLTSGSEQNGQVKMVVGQKPNQPGNMRATLDSMEQDQFFSLLTHIQRRNMDDQRCVLDPNKKTPSTPKDKDTGHTDSDIEQLLNLVATTQRYRLDDQRVSIKKLPDLHVAAGSDQDRQMKTAAGQKSNQLVKMRAISDSMEQDQFFSLLSHVQRGHMDDQRCVLDPNKKILCTSKDKDTGGTDFDIEQLLNLVATTQRCRLDDQRVYMKTIPGLHVTFNIDQDGHVKLAANQESNQLGSMGAVLGLVDQDQYSVVCHEQKGNVDDQGCALLPSKDTMRKEGQRKAFTRL
ncbi:uncharacterized protein LOC125717553 isoform X3 [Brienomyrus brachyistius]|uniref:uncharacterized protein LOC125717553 isoform X3 n=1 Tax=Brienomyrus brachyistius TaxID=42636 RepID=UPI0020B3E70C|nr:uncharacterized protein LOC125717553 isoform X3 [Brienomyrus brachyistius]